MGSDLETLCGQAVGAGQLHILGIYMQRSWIITLAFQNLSASVKLSIASAIMNAMLGAPVLHCSDDSSGLLEKPRYGDRCHFYLVCCSSLSPKIAEEAAFLGRLRGLPFEKGGTRKQSVTAMVGVASYVIREFI
ncbi:unnamed protein product [Musa acuminata subsp. malaccensis]|uniref:(wild Malaysian banana) hypothetical protein n=1 Tax=Musa acuminata subsp. malaccensis TaxID=214687 RepID=A0A804KHP4_MUSAM|nr:unnamed protein product [Musa acuminata subsp. malaccensis]